MSDDLGPFGPTEQHPNEPGEGPAFERTWGDPRWNGGRPEITPRRAAAIAAKRAYADENGVIRPHVRELLAASVRGELVLEAMRRGELDAITAERVIAALPSEVVLKLRMAHVRVLHRLVNACARFEAPGVVLTNRELGELVALRSRASVHTATGELVELGVLPAPVPDHARRFRASSRRGNAWTLSPLLYAVAGTVGSRAHAHEAINKTDRHPERSPEITTTSGDLALDPAARRKPGAARRTSDLPMAISSAGVLQGPVAPAAPCPDAAPEAAGAVAPDEGGRLTTLDAHLAERAAAGDTFAAELLEQVRRDRALRARGLRSLDEHMRSCAIAARADRVERGGES